MGVLQDKAYEPVVLDDDQKTAVKTKVKGWVDIQVNGMTDDEKRSALPQLKSYVNQCVGAVMGSLPTGVDRVDGGSVRPILNEVVDEAVAELPEPPEVNE